MKRYTVTVLEGEPLEMEDVNGDWVPHSDLAARDKRHAEVVRQVQWSAGAYFDRCPLCKAIIPPRFGSTGHDADCQLAAMLRELEAT